VEEDEGREPGRKGERGRGAGSVHGRWETRIQEVAFLRW